MSEEAFWAKYFYMRQKIGRPTDKDDGKSSPLPPKKEEVEDFKWDDSDEESEFAIVQKPNVELTEEGEVLKEDETEADSEKKDVVKETTKTKEEAGTAIVTPSSTTKPTTEKAVKTETKPDAKKMKMMTMTIGSDYIVYLFAISTFFDKIKHRRFHSRFYDDQHY